MLDGHCNRLRAMTDSASKLSASTMAVARAAFSSGTPVIFENPVYSIRVL